MSIERVCKYCGKTLHVKPYLVKIGKGNYCNWECFQKSGVCHKKGAENVRYGIPRPKEVNDKISKSLRGEKNNNYGKHFSKEHRQKIGDAQRGEKGHNWKNGITPIRTKIWRSEKFQNWRNTVFEWDNYTCQLCGQRGGLYLQAHHILSFADYPKYRLEADNGITYCKECHGIITSILAMGDVFQPLPAHI